LQNATYNTNAQLIKKN